MFLIDASLSNDGSYLHYCLEWNNEISNAVLGFINDAFVNLQLKPHIWDPTAVVLTYIRGYSSNIVKSVMRIALELLSTDLGGLRPLLAHLSIPLVHSFIGLGLGTHIALHFLVRNPQNCLAFRRCWLQVLVKVVRRRRVRMVMPHLPRYNTEKYVSLVADKVVARWFTADVCNRPEWLHVKEIIAQGIATVAQGSILNIEVTCSEEFFPCRTSCRDRLCRTSTDFDGAGNRTCHGN
ncbi:hypothetical protein BDR03DRAFT_516384 [Suillus americanus]|nr:hypothetical protein BDR03DRAFT_516384 [Suillus americanus]